MDLLALLSVRHARVENLVQVELLELRRILQNHVFDALAEFVDSLHLALPDLGEVDSVKGGLGVAHDRGNIFDDPCGHFISAG